MNALVSRWYPDQIQYVQSIFCATDGLKNPIILFSKKTNADKILFDATG